MTATRTKIRNLQKGNLILEMMLTWDLRKDQKEILCEELRNNFRVQNNIFRKLLEKGLTK